METDRYPFATITNSDTNPYTLNYTVTPTANGCSGTTATYSITVNPVPNIGPQNFNICSGSLFSGLWQGINIIPLNTNYTWNVSNNVQVIGETNQQNPVSSFSQTLTNLSQQNQNVQYTISPLSNNCLGVPFNLNINIIPLPQINVGQSFTKTCGMNVNGNFIGGNNLQGYSYSWTPAVGLSSSSISNPFANPTSTQTYSLTVTDQQTLCSSVGNVTVTVNNTNPIALAGNNSTITCTTNPNGASIGSAFLPNLAYSWYPTGNLSSPNSSATIANPSMTTSYILTVTDLNNQCESHDTVIITVNKSIPMVYAGPDTSFCEGAGNNIQLFGSSNGISYNWQPGMAFLNPNQLNPVASLNATTPLY